MSVYKEAIYGLNHIQTNSKQVFPDAADYGAPCKKGDDTWNWAKQLVDWYAVKGSRKVETYSTGTTVSAIIEYMPNEHNSPRYEKVRITYVTCRKNKTMDGYIYLEKI